MATSDSGSPFFQDMTMDGPKSVAVILSLGLTKSGQQNRSPCGSCAQTALAMEGQPDEQDPPVSKSS